MIAFSFLCFLFVNTMGICYAMDGTQKKVSTWRFKGPEFTIEVKTTGKVHSLTTQDENKILRWLKSKNIDEEQEEFIRASLFVFINAQIQEKPEVIDAIDRRHNNYLFRVI